MCASPSSQNDVARRVLDAAQAGILIAPKDAACVLGMSVPALLAAAKRGAIPCLRVTPKCPRFRARDIATLAGISF
jgi:hypothetical protein